MFKIYVRDFYYCFNSLILITLFPTTDCLINQNEDKYLSLLLPLSEFKTWSQELQDNKAY